MSAKIVAKSRARTQTRYGYVTMALEEEAKSCIKELDGIELKGRKITVEVVNELISVGYYRSWPAIFGRKGQIN